MTQTSRLIYALSFAIAAIGFLLPFWPLCVLGVLLAAASGRYLFGILLALLLDIGSGAPTGAWRFLLLPFTAFAVAAALARALGNKYFLDKTPPGTL